jgi:hypothetical protein
MLLVVVRRKRPLKRKMCCLTPRHLSLRLWPTFVKTMILVCCFSGVDMGFLVRFCDFPSVFLILFFCWYGSSLVLLLVSSYATVRLVLCFYPHVFLDFWICLNTIMNMLKVLKDYFYKMVNIWIKERGNEKSLY